MIRLFLPLIVVYGLTFAIFWGFGAKNHRGSISDDPRFTGFIGRVGAYSALFLLGLMTVGGVTGSILSAGRDYMVIPAIIVGVAILIGVFKMASIFVGNLRRFLSNPY
jgi:hypothetical protein